MHAIVSKTAHVAVICEAGTARHEIVASLRQLGFDHVAPLSTVGDLAAAGQHLDEAKQLDDSSERVRETQVKQAIVSGDKRAKAQNLLRQVTAKAEVVRFSNNRAVALIHAEEFEQAVALYEATLKALPTDEARLRCIVHYNLALGYARQQRLSESADQLNLAMLKPDPKVRPKALSLLERIRQAQNQGTDLILRVDNNMDLDASFGFETLGGEDVSAKADVFDPFAADDDIPAGAACLYKIFRNQDELDAFTKELVKNLGTPRRVA